MTLLKPSQIASLQKLARRAFTTEATVRRPTFGSDATGDDAIDDDPIEIGKVMGWLTSSPTPEPTIDGGAALVTSNTYRFGCGIEADIKPRDLLDIGSNTYVVTDTTADETWPSMLSCSLRLRE